MSRARLAMQEGDPEGRRKVTREHNVRRKLFQDEENDRDDNRNDDQANRSHEDEESRRYLTMAERRWNFDFVNEEPLPGRWEWRRVAAEGSSGSTANGGRKNFENVATDQREESQNEAGVKIANDVDHRAV